MSKQSNKPYIQDPYYKRWMAGLSQRTKENYRKNKKLDNLHWHDADTTDYKWDGKDLDGKSIIEDQLSLLGFRHIWYPFARVIISSF
jgi:hypothetical protein